jgi:hypothetical protein
MHMFLPNLRRACTILSRWVSRAAAASCRGSGMIGRPRYWQKASRGFEPRSLDSESKVLTVTPRGQLKLAAFCAPTHAGAVGVQTCCADRPAERHWRMSADRGGITTGCKENVDVSTFGLSFPRGSPLICILMAIWTHRLCREGVRSPGHSGISACPYSPCFCRCICSSP